VPDARPYLLAIALEAAPLGLVRLARPVRRRSAYVASLVTDADTTAITWTLPTAAGRLNSSDDEYSRGI
jgi:hypothetical protein